MYISLKIFLSKQAWGTGASISEFMTDLPPAEKTPEQCTEIPDRKYI